MFGNFAVADIIAYYISKIDNKCRSELRRGIITSERDYVTALSTRIRDEINIQLQLNCHSQTVRPRVENENGVDGIIIFKCADEVKIGLFEAKRPQITINNYGWDYLSSRNMSHFSEQIKNQHKWINEIALFEIFFNEGIDGYLSPPFEYFGSSCIWHNNAYQFMHKENLIFNSWTTDKLKKILEKNSVSIYSVIFDIISCKQGKKHKIDMAKQSVNIISDQNKEIIFEIPLPFENEDIQEDKRILDFLNQNNIENYTFINLDKMEKRI